MNYILFFNNFHYIILFLSVYNDKLRKRNFLYLCKVTFDAKGGELNDDAEVPVYKTEKITDTKANDLTAIHDPTRAGYKFTGWYTADDQPLNVNEIITSMIAAKHNCRVAMLSAEKKFPVQIRIPALYQSKHNI